VTICISTDGAQNSREMFEELSNGAVVTMPLQETFYSPAYGNVTDKFGVNFFRSILKDKMNIHI